jgi:acyl carrier protein
MITSQDVIGLIAEAGIEVDTAKLRDEVDLYGQGLDSLDMANLELRVQERYNIDIKVEQSVRLRTIKDFVKLVNTDRTMDTDVH